MDRMVVFDLDGSLETPYFKEEDSEKVRAWMCAHPCGNTYDELHAVISAAGNEWPHFFFAGAFELLRWVHDHGFDIVFFSNAIAERNLALCPILMDRAFAGVEQPRYRVLSREDCVDTERFHDDEKSAPYQGFWHGNYKKKLAGTVLPPESLPNAIMIEDDCSYACKAEERNFVYGVYGGCAADFISRPSLNELRGPDFHLPFYFCGMLNRILARSERDGISLVDAATQVQYGDYGLDFPSDGERFRTIDEKRQLVDVPLPATQKDFRIYVEGLDQLRTYNSALRFWGDVDESAQSWPPYGQGTF